MSSASADASSGVAAHVRTRVSAADEGRARLELYVCPERRQPKRQRRAAEAVGRAADSATLAFDLGSFGAIMTDGELGALSRQLVLCYSHNRALPQPFRLALCGLRDAAPLAAHLDVHSVSRWVLDRHDAPPWDVWPRASLVYLSADADEVLDGARRPGDVLVVGGLVDHANVSARVGAARDVAAAHGLRTARLPIDDVVTIRKTSLTCLAVVQILANHAANGGDWAAAVRDAPAMSIDGAV